MVVVVVVVVVVAMIAFEWLHTHEGEVLYCVNSATARLTLTSVYEFFLPISCKVYLLLPFYFLIL